MRKLFVLLLFLMPVMLMGQDNKIVQSDEEKLALAKGIYQAVLKGANQGIADHQALLGKMYEEGTVVVKKDYEQALFWYLKAADQGNVLAQTRLGGMYENGYGVPRNNNKALKWYQKAAASGYEDAKKCLTHLQEKMELEERMIAAKESKVSAEENYKMGMARYDKKEYQEAFSYLQLASDQGYGLAQLQLAKMYIEGNGVECNYAKCAEWSQKAAEQGLPDAQTLLGSLYLNGEGIPQDVNQAFKLFQAAAKQDDPVGYYFLGYIYEDGITGEKDKEKAIEMYQKALRNTPDLQYAKDGLIRLGVMKPDHAVKATAKKVAKPVLEEKNTFVVIIGNEKYKNEVDVPFAENDARAFREYVMNTLGVKEEDHIKYVENAGLNDLYIALDWLVKAMQVSKGNGKAIFYYAGHGIPNESDKSAYLLPVDGIGSLPRSAYSLSELYETLGKLEAKSVTIFLDACFSGSKREKGMLTSARGVAVKVKQSTPQGNMVVFTAAQGDETAYPYTEQEHGLFTYCLLKKLNDSEGDITLGELSDYLEKEVRQRSFEKNGKMQTPATLVSAKLQNGWRAMKLR